MTGQYELYDGTLPHVAGSDTSLAAANDAKRSAGRKRAQIKALIQATPMTCDAVEDLTGWPHQSVSARIRELVQLGEITDTGRRDLTRSGRKARVYETSTEGNSE